MANENSTTEIFEEADRNKDGRIDKNEFWDWVSNTEGLTSSTNKSSKSAFNLYNADSQNPGNPSTFDKHVSYGTTTGFSGLTNETVIQTSSVEETNRYLERSAANIYRDPNPRIIRRERTDSPITSEQRVFLRYLQPPALPPPGPLIIKEVRAEQPPSPPPLVIREHPPPLAQSPPLILRERPPTPPAIIPCETIIRTLPSLPTPPRSVVIERFPPAPEKSRDIIIERWIPYGHQSERRKIVQPTPATINCSQPTHIIVVYGALKTRIFRKFEKLGAAQESPGAHAACYGTSLSDSATLVQQARNVDVAEDIPTPIISSSISICPRGNTVDFYLSNEILHRNQPLADTASSGITHGYTGAEAANLDNKRLVSTSHGHRSHAYTNLGNKSLRCKSYSSSACNFADDHALNMNICIRRSARHVGNACFRAPDTYRFGELKQAKYKQYF